MGMIKDKCIDFEQRQHAAIAALNDLLELTRDLSYLEHGDSFSQLNALAKDLEPMRDRLGAFDLLRFSLDND